LRDDDEASLGWVHSFWTDMQRHSTGRMYLNFPGLGEGTNFVRDAFGTQGCRKLQAIKAKYDPDNLFGLKQNIVPAST
jgi:hypothetical protein